MNYDKTKKFLYALAQTTTLPFYCKGYQGCLEQQDVDKNGSITAIWKSDDEEKVVMVTETNKRNLILVVSDRASGDFGAEFRENSNGDMLLEYMNLQILDYKDREISLNDASFLYSSYLLISNQILEKITNKEN